MNPKELQAFDYLQNLNTLPMENQLEHFLEMQNSKIKDSEMPKNVLSELTKLYNQDLLCRKRQRWPLVTLDTTKITKLLEKPSDEELRTKNCLLKAQELCALFPDELFFAGGFILFCMGIKETWTRLPLPDVDFFIVAQSEKRAIEIVTACIRHLKETNTEGCYYRFLRSKGALTYLEHGYPCDDQEISELLGNYALKFQFIHRLYSHPSQIVGMFDLFPCGVLYSHHQGFLATPLAKYSIENKLLFIDPTRASSSFRNRISKYTERGFKICIPNALGFDIDVNLQDMRIFNLHKYVKPWIKNFEYRYWDSGNDHWQSKDRFVNSDYQECDNQEEILIKSLYYHVPLTETLPLLVREEDFQVDLETMLLIHHQTGNDLFPALKYLKVEMLRAAFSGEKLTKALGIFALEKEEMEIRWQELGKNLAEQRQEDLRKHFRPYIEGGFFRIANPGQQGGGSFHPTVQSGSEFWDPATVSPILVGLSHEVYWLLKQICFNNACGVYLSKDIFRMLCEWCVITQTM